MQKQLLDKLLEMEENLGRTCNDRKVHQVIKNSRAVMSQL